MRRYGGPSAFAPVDGMLAFASKGDAPLRLAKVHNKSNKAGG